MLGGQNPCRASCFGLQTVELSQSIWTKWLSSYKQSFSIKKIDSCSFFSRLKMTKKMWSLYTEVAPYCTLRTLMFQLHFRWEKLTLSSGPDSLSFFIKDILIQHFSRDSFLNICTRFYINFLSIQYSISTFSIKLQNIQNYSIYSCTSIFKAKCLHLFTSMKP